MNSKIRKQISKIEKKHKANIDKLNYIGILPKKECNLVDTILLGLIYS